MQAVAAQLNYMHPANPSWICPVCSTCYNDTIDSGHGCGSVEEHLSSVLQALCLIPRTEKKMECLRLVLVTYSSLKRGEGVGRRKEGGNEKGERKRDRKVYLYQVT